MQSCGAASEFQPACLAHTGHRWVESAEVPPKVQDAESSNPLLCSPKQRKNILHSLIVVFNWLWCFLPFVFIMADLWVWSLYSSNVRAAGEKKRTRKLFFLKFISWQGTGFSFKRMYEAERSPVNMFTCAKAPSAFVWMSPRTHWLWFVVIS